mgnify:CR=1 FL=1
MSLYGSVKQLSVELHADTRQNGRIGFQFHHDRFSAHRFQFFLQKLFLFCLLYTSDAADD